MGMIVDGTTAIAQLVAFLIWMFGIYMLYRVFREWKRRQEQDKQVQEKLDQIIHLLQKNSTERER